MCPFGDLERPGSVLVHLLSSAGFVKADVDPFIYSFNHSRRNQIHLEVSLGCVTRSHGRKPTPLLRGGRLARHPVFVHLDRARVAEQPDRYESTTPVSSLWLLPDKSFLE